MVMRQMLPRGPGAALYICRCCDDWLPLLKIRSSTRKSLASSLFLSSLYKNEGLIVLCPVLERESPISWKFNIALKRHFD